VLTRMPEQLLAVTNDPEANQEELSLPSAAAAYFPSSM
jgi:hypothetical protein